MNPNGGKKGKKKQEKTPGSPQKLNASPSLLVEGWRSEKKQNTKTNCGTIGRE